MLVKDFVEKYTPKLMPDGYFLINDVEKYLYKLADKIDLSSFKIYSDEMTICAFTTFEKTGPFNVLIVCDDDKGFYSLENGNIETNNKLISLGIIIPETCPKLTSEMKSHFTNPRDTVNYNDDFISGPDCYGQSYTLVDGNSDDSDRTFDNLFDKLPIWALMSSLLDIGYLL